MAIEVKIIGDAKNLIGEINKSEKSVIALNQAFQLAAGVANIASDAFGKVAGAVSDVVLTGARFEQEMANLKATIGGITNTEFRKLNDAARKLGATTQFSATQAAAAMQELARAGFNANEILEVSGAVLDTAAASGIDLAFAANTVAGAYKNFAQTGIEAEEISDLLSRTANSSRQTFEDLASAVDRSGAVASQFGLSFQDLTQILGTVADSGFRGEVAATALNGALVRLGKETPEISKVLAQIGLTFDDINPSTNTFREIIDKVSESGANAQQIIQLLGLEAGPKLVSLFSKGGSALDEFRLKQENANSSSETARIRNETLSGSLRTLSSAYESLKITASASLESASKSSVDFLTVSIRAFDEFISKAQELNQSIEDNINKPLSAAIKKFLAETFSLQKTLSAKGGFFGLFESGAESVSSFFSSVTKDFEGTLRTFIGGIRKARTTDEMLAKRIGKSLEENKGTQEEINDFTDELFNKLEKEFDLRKKNNKQAKEGARLAEAATRTGKKGVTLRDQATSAGRQVAGTVVGVEAAIRGGQEGGPIGALIGFGTQVLLANEKFKEQIGRLNEAIIALLDPIIESLVPIIDTLVQILNELRPLFDVIGEQLSLIMKDLAPLLEELGPLIRDLVELLRPFFPLLKLLLPPLRAIAPAARFLAEAIGSLRDGINALNGNVKALKDAIENFDISGGGGGGGFFGGGIGRLGAAVSTGGLSEVARAGGFGFSQGGLITKDRMTRLPGMEPDAGFIMAHEGEKVVSNRDMNESQGSVININVSAGMGADGRGIANVLREELEKLSLTGRLRV